MKTFPGIPIVIVVLWLAAAGCSDAAREQTLISAEVMMEQHPDSALTLLSSLGGSRLSGELRARHALLTSQALDKNYIDITDDSIINIALDYYSANPQHERRLSQAFYYKGVIDFNGGDNHMAIYHFAIADTLAARLGDTPLRAKANATIALALKHLTYLEEELKYSKKSLRFFELSGDSLRAATQRINVASAYCDLGYADTALYILSRPDCRPSTFFMALSLIDLGRVDEVEQLLNEDSTLHHKSKVLAGYSKLLVKLGRITEAESALLKAKRCARSQFDSASCLVAEGAIYRRKNMWREFAMLADSASTMNYNDLQLLKRQSTPIGLTNAYNYISQIDRIESNRQRYVMSLWIILGSMLFIAAIILALWLYRRAVKRRDEVRRLSTRYEEATLKYQAELDNISDTSAKEAVQTRERLAMLSDDLHAALIKNQPEAQEISEQIRQMMEQGCMHELETYVTANFDSLIEKARTLNVAETDIKLLILLKAGFSHNQIAVLTGVSYNSISSRKYRLSKKLKSAGIDI